MGCFLNSQPGDAAELINYLGFIFNSFTTTVFFMLGLAAITFSTTFFGFFSSRRRFVIPLAIACFLSTTGLNEQPLYYTCLFQEGHSTLQSTWRLLEIP